MDKVYKQLSEKLMKSADFTEKDLTVGMVKGKLLFFDGSVDTAYLSEFVMQPLLASAFEFVLTAAEAEKLIDSGAMYTVAQTEETECDKLIVHMCKGRAVLYIEGASKMYVFEARNSASRSVTESSSESVTKGPKDSFVERYRSNLSLIRSRLSSPELVVEDIEVGRKSHTKIGIVYISSTVSEKVLNNVKTALKSLDIDYVSSVGIIEEALEGEKHSIIPQVLATERPDRFCAALNEGSVGVVIQGFPVTYLAPVTLLHHISAPEDYARNHIIGSCIRVLRYIMLILSLVFPAFFVAVTGFHQEMLPTELLQSVMKAQSEVPFTGIVQMVMILIAFEILIEAGLRMPQNIGQAVSIVGALVVGDAAVNAKIISPITVIVAAISVIGTFALPDQDLSNALRLARLGLCLLVALMGIAGLALGIVFIVLNLSSVYSAGVPYLSPVLSVSPPTKDTFMRRPFKEDKQRPEFADNRDKIRRKDK